MVIDILPHECVFLKGENIPLRTKEPEKASCSNPKNKMSRHYGISHTGRNSKPISLSPFQYSISTRIPVKILIKV
jgi:hypothetical protein